VKLMKLLKGGASSKNLRTSALDRTFESLTEAAFVPRERQACTVSLSGNALRSAETALSTFGTEWRNGLLRINNRRLYNKLAQCILHETGEGTKKGKAMLASKRTQIHSMN
jgi:hypothetical protein